TQSLPYRGFEEGVKFPVETFVDNGGDCDDKSLFLYGLLAQEGYNVSLLYFETEHHLAVGVASRTNTFQKSGYAFIETTSPSYIGMIPDRVEDGHVLSSSPLIIRFGGGTKMYESGGETEWIYTVMRNAEQRIREKIPGLPLSRNKLFQMATDGNLERRYLTFYGYDQEYPVFIKQVGIFTYILSHQFDRKGTVAWLAEKNL
ncbi:MAG: hypothetical protein LUP99_04080, partial [Methanomicrobiales archaeon]|nr:hypothetical protein [Methanomicrobiales archaeon]